MSDEHRRSSTTDFDIECLPASVQTLYQVMLGINPDFSIQQWLEQKAEEDLTLIERDLERERIHLAQKIHRIDQLSSRAKKEVAELPLGQKNLFDCFDLSETMTHLRERHEVQDDDDFAHPASVFLNLMQDEGADDPLLAITAQKILVLAEARKDKIEPWITAKELFKILGKQEISEKECEEAIDYLIMSHQLFEIEEDCFVAED